MSRHVKTATFVAFSNSALQRVHQGHQDIPDLNIFLKASEKVLRRFWKTLGKTTLVVLVWHSVWPLWPRSKFQGLDATGTKLYVANLPEDIQALIVRCCEKVVIAVVFVAHWQYGNMATWPQVYTIIILYISYYISINIIIYIYIFIIYTYLQYVCTTAGVAQFPSPPRIFSNQHAKRSELETVAAWKLKQLQALRHVFTMFLLWLIRKENQRM